MVQILGLSYARLGVGLNVPCGSLPVGAFYNSVRGPWGTRYNAERTDMSYLKNSSHKKMPRKMLRIDPVEEKKIDEKDMAVTSSSPRRRPQNILVLPVKKLWSICLMYQST